jgi:hypothetical protein
MYQVRELVNEKAEVVNRKDAIVLPLAKNI